VAPSRALAVVLLATIFGLAPALADARPGIRGGASTSISRSGGGMRASSGARPAGGYSGGARASTRPSGAGSANVARSGDRMANNSGNRIDGGNRVNQGDRVNNGNINRGNINTGDINRGNINTGNVNINVDDRRYDWDDHYRPVGGALAVGAIAGATAAAIGSTMYALPPGCSPYPYGGYSYYHCGGVYYETRYEGDTVVYVTVAEPH
jgi:hypothetical protein